MADRPWKKAERRAAKILGGHRVPFSGGLGPHSGLPKGDVMGVEAFVFVEVKHRKSWAVQAWIRELEQKARLGQPWLLVVSTPAVQGQYAVLPLKRLVEFVKEADVAALARGLGTVAARSER